MVNDFRIAVVGIGATGAVLAASLLERNPDTILVDPRPGLAEAIEKTGIRISGEMTLQVPVHNFLIRIAKLHKYNPDIIFVSTKTFHLPGVLEELKNVVKSGTKIISTHNGLGTEDLISKSFVPGSAFRMSLNYGVSFKNQTDVKMLFFNRPNHLGAVIPENRELGCKVAEILSTGGLDTEYVEDIKYYVWKKMIMKCTMASLCAATDMTIKDALAFPPTREIAEGCFHEILAVAKAQGYDFGNEYINEALAYLEKVGVHKDSMCVDIENKTRTEIDFLGGKVVEYANKMNISIPFYTTMTNLIKSKEHSFLNR